MRHKSTVEDEQSHDGSDRYAHWLVVFFHKTCCVYHQFSFARGCVQYLLGSFGCPDFLLLRVEQRRQRGL